MRTLMMAHVMMHEEENWRGEVWLEGPDLDEPRLVGFWFRVAPGEPWHEVAKWVLDNAPYLRRAVIDWVIEHAEE